MDKYLDNLDYRTGLIMRSRDGERLHEYILAHTPIIILFFNF